MCSNRFPRRFWRSGFFAVGRQSGFGLLEMVIAVALLVTSAAGLVAVGRLSVRASRETLQRTEAAFLLEEGLEAARTIRDRDWSAFSALATSTPHHLFFSESAWNATSTEQVIEGRFFRTITLTDVYRDAVDSIAGSGTGDPETKKVTAVVSWSVQGATSSISATTYLANIFGQ